MRDIRFRAWDKENNRWFDDENFGISLQPDGTVWISFAGDEWHQCDYMDIQLNTGLLDKNGKEIFEGDILAEYFGAGKNRRLLTQVVEWNENTARFSLPQPLARFEITGNIYKNPELLK